MTGEQRVLEFVRNAAAPISGRNVAIMLAEHVAAGSVSSYLAMLVERGLLFNQRIPNGKGKLYWHKKFSAEATMTGAPNRSQAVAPAPSIPWPTALPSKRVLSPIGELKEQSLERAKDWLGGPESEPKPAPPADKAEPEPAKPAKARGAEAAPHPDMFKRKGYEFSLTRGPVGFDLPHDLSWQEIVTLAMMLDAYGQLKRHEEKVAA